MLATEDASQSGADPLEAAFERAYGLARTLDLNSDMRTAQERELATAVLNMRQQIRTASGAIDWTGATKEYQTRIREILSAVDVDDEGRKRLMNRLRGHYRSLLPGLTKQEDIADASEAVEAHTIAVDSNFFEAVNVFTAEHGRSSSNSAEALQLIIAANRLLTFVQVDPILEEGDPAPALVAQTIQSTVALRAQNLREQLNG